MAALKVALLYHAAVCRILLHAELRSLARLHCCEGHVLGSDGAALPLQHVGLSRRWLLTGAVLLAKTLQVWCPVIVEVVGLCCWKLSMVLAL